MTPHLAWFEVRASPVAPAAGLALPHLAWFALNPPASEFAFPGDFWTAFVAWFRADPLLPGLFPGGLVGGRAAAPRQQYPYLKFVGTEPQEPLSADDWPMAATFSAYSCLPQAGDDQAKGLAWAVARKLDDTAGRAPLRFGPWVESGHVTAGVTSVGELKDPGPGGSPVYRCDVSFRFWVKTEAPALGVGAELP
jgi:hypothetical protein